MSEIEKNVETATIPTGANLKFWAFLLVWVVIISGAVGYQMYKILNRGIENPDSQFNVLLFRAEDLTSKMKNIENKIIWLENDVRNLEKEIGIIEFKIDKANARNSK